jgi:HTH-type transcriptional regulator, transcriptional repressor of NAD biosynthesis genes
VATHGGGEMTSHFHRGLVVGKFSPLHRGHELLIREAFSRCREVVIISYAKPEPAGCGAERREQWLKELFPDALRLVVSDAKLRKWGGSAEGFGEIPPDDAEESLHRRFVGFLCRRILGVTVDAVFTSEDYGDGFARELTRYFRKEIPDTPEVKHILVDRERIRIPVSGTQIRSSVHGNRQWLSPQVYTSFIRRICLLGGESSGKSTLAAALADHLETRHVPEYGRELWEQRGGALRIEDMRTIAAVQVAREEAAARKSYRYLFCDTSPLTTLLYTRHLFQRNDRVVEELAERPYDLTVLCEPDFRFVQDGTRQDASFRNYQHAWYVEELTRRGTAWVKAGGSIRQRVAAVTSFLEQMRT